MSSIAKRLLPLPFFVCLTSPFFQRHFCTLLFFQSNPPLQSSLQSILSSLFASQSLFIIRFVDQPDALAIFFCLLFHFMFIAQSVTSSLLYFSMSFGGLTDRIDKIERDCSLVAVSCPNHAGRKKTIFFLAPPQRSMVT